MRYTSLQQVKDSRSILPEGIDFFIEYPLEFIRLVKEDPALAQKFADHFSSEQVEEMICSAYGTNSILKISVDKFFSILLELINRPQDIIFRESLSDSQMQKAMWDLGLKLYDVDKYCPEGIYSEKIPKSGERLRHVYAYTPDHGKKLIPIFWCRYPTNPLTDPTNYRIYPRDLREIYQNATRKTKIIGLILDVSKTLLKKLKTPGILDPEFKNEKWTGEPQTNRVLPALAPALEANFKIEVSSVLARIFQFTSDDIVLRELAKPNKETSSDYLKVIIQQLPMFKRAYNQVHLALSNVAMGKNGYSNLVIILKTFNFDILEALSKVKSKNPYALQFYQIGELCLQNDKQKNPMLERYPASAPKYEKPRQPKFEIIGGSSSSSSSQTLIFSNTLVPSAPPALLPPPYNSQLNINEIAVAPPHIPLTDGVTYPKIT